MSGTEQAALAAALAPLISRVRTDVTARKGKDGRQSWTREPLTADRLARHLNGGPARGVSQIRAGESVTMVAVLDFDSHGGEVDWLRMSEVVREVEGALVMAGGAPIAFRSSGGRGVHLYLLWETGQDAYSVREWLRAVLGGCGLRSGAKGLIAGQVEIFPKQDEVGVDGFGNQVVLPLAGQSVPLMWEDMAGCFVPGSRESVVGMDWPMSEGVPRAARPERAVPSAEIVGWDELRELLRWIPNDGDGLDYDDWRNVVFAIHKETGGNGEGLALAHEFSSRSTRYVGTFLDERVWPYVNSERAGAVGIGTLRRMAGEAGWHPRLHCDEFEDVSAGDERPPVPRIENKVGGVGAGGGGVLPGVRRRGIPEAHHLCTDQANANRIKDAYGSLVLVAAGRWYVWDGRRWAADEGDVYRYACRLSQIVGEEARGWAAKSAAADASGDGAKAKELAAVAKAVMGWAVKCEMKGTIEAAVGLLRKMLTVETDVLDRDPWALNVANGIVDLRTGVLRRHSPAEYHTKIVDVAYRPEARAPVWERTLVEIAGGGAAGEEMAGFLRRWFGYCLTGDTREQCFVVHWGGGSNGKSTVLGLMAQTMGDYASTAAPGLLVGGKGDRHPTEIAALAGRRMVTTHESGEGVVLREDFVKQATGGDRLVGRWMREDFFEFSPVHKLQLLTNHKPAVKSQDEGIWRRVMLVPYTESFGTAEEVREGKRGRVKDMGLGAVLAEELEGVLAWRVRGAVEWANSGLAAPESVKAASRAYRVEQDRVGAFVRECCEVGAGFEVALTDGMAEGLYPAYQGWIKDSGLLPLSKPRFLDEVLRVVSRSVAFDRKIGSWKAGQQRRVKIVSGLRLLADEG